MIQKAMTASASLVCQQPLLCVPVDGKIGLSLQTLGRGTDALSARAHRFHHWRGLALPPSLLNIPEHPEKSQRERLCRNLLMGLQSRIRETGDGVVMIDGGGRIKETTMSVRHNSRSTLFDSARCCRRRGQSATADDGSKSARPSSRKLTLGIAQRAQAHRGARRKNDCSGTGEPCGKSYLKRQAEIIENWIGLVEALSSGDEWERRSAA